MMTMTRGEKGTKNKDARLMDDSDRIPLLDPSAHNPFDGQRAAEVNHVMPATEVEPVG